MNRLTEKDISQLGRLTGRGAEVVSEQISTFRIFLVKKEASMKVRVTDIPPEGRDFEFEIESASLNERLRPVEEQLQKGVVREPIYVFSKSPHASVHLELEGSTVMYRGTVAGEYQTRCAHCGEDISKAIETKINLFLKPISARDKPADLVDDLQLGFYDGKEVECSEVAEEYLVLAIPYRDTCDDTAACEARYKDVSKDESTPDPRLAVLSQIKLH